MGRPERFGRGPATHAPAGWLPLGLLLPQIEDSQPVQHQLEVLPRPLDPLRLGGVPALLLHPLPRRHFEPPPLISHLFLLQLGSPLLRLGRKLLIEPFDRAEGVMVPPAPEELVSGVADGNGGNQAALVGREDQLIEGREIERDIIV